MIAHIFKHARERLDFKGEVSAAKRVAACKRFLRLEGEMIRMRHKAGDSGVKVALARATMIDVMLTHLFDYAIQAWKRTQGEPPTSVAMLALGGYGRAELCPRSDIDIMFLYPSKVKEPVVKPFQEALVNEILYVLWDCGLKIGHSTRSIDQVLVEARKEVMTKTSLLESRLIAGSENLYTSFSQAYTSFVTNEEPKAYIEVRLTDQANRRAKYGNTVFIQEPDIKNGVGGLRDYQNAVWMAQVKLGITNIAELVKHNYLRTQELRDFQRAYNFLLRVRNELHFLSKHTTDVMSLDVQPRVALHLGYARRDILGRVEDFMHDYYRHAQTIFRIATLIETRLALTLAPKTSQFSFRELLRVRRSDRLKRIDGFILRGNELAAEKPNVFQEDPVRLIRVFRHRQQLNCSLDFNLTNLIRESLPLINRRVLNSPDANVSFRSILEEAGAVYPALNAMHELGVLGRFIPEFDRLTCLVQHEYYHRYTADIHTLSAIRELDDVFSVAEPVGEKYREELHHTSSPTLLYLILLLHDIGKARGIEGHSESGVKIAGPLLERMQIDVKSREVVTFIIKNHLIMARFWQKHDLDDPKTATAFAELVGEPDKLRLLYVHTFCDARGTAASLWNSYKDTLHTSLFRNTLERLTHGEAVDRRNLERKQMSYQELISKKIAGISQDEVTAHFNLLPERYFIHTDSTEIALHIKMINRLLKSITEAESVGTLKPIIDWKDDLNRSLTVVNVVTWDRAGLFYKLAGAFSVAGLSILSAKVISRADHIAIDTFFVVEPGRGIVQNHAATDSFAKTVEAALVTNKDLLPEILAQAKKYSGTRYGAPEEGLHHSFPPSVEVYHELSMQRTIVEIQAYDQIGLLYQLSKAIYDHGFDITFARINTERGVALDTFYIESANHEPTEDVSRLHALRESLGRVIASETVQKAAL